MHWGRKINSTTSSELQDAPPLSPILCLPHLPLFPFPPPLLSLHLLPGSPDPGAPISPSPPWCHHNSCASSCPTSIPTLFAEQDCYCKCPGVTGATEERLGASRLWGPQPGQKREFNHSLGALPLPGSPYSLLERWNTTPVAQEVCKATTPYDCIHIHHSHFTE